MNVMKSSSIMVKVITLLIIQRVLLLLLLLSMVQRLVNLILERGFLQLKRKFFFLRRLLCFVMLFCITFLATSVITNAAGSRTSQTKSFTRTFTLSLYPTSSTVTDNSVNLTDTGSNATYSFSLREVDGSTTGTITHGTTVDTVRLVNGDSVISGSATPNSSSSSGTITGSITDSGGVRYFDTDLTFEVQPFLFTKSDFNNTDFDYCVMSAWGFSNTVSEGNLVNSRLTFFDGNPISKANYFTKNSISYTNAGTTYISPTMLYNTHFNYAIVSPADTYNHPLTLTFTVGFTMSCADCPTSIVANNSQPTQDITGNQLQEQNNQITQDTNSVEHDTNNKVTSFFNSFFDNLIGVFVPESGFFSQWFSDLNTFMSQKLGFLWAPFDFIISFLNGVYSGSGSASITFPELAWIDGTVIIPQTQFSFDNIGGQSFTDLRDMIYFATDVILLGAVVMQFYQKLKLVFEGGSS